MKRTIAAALITTLITGCATTDGSHDRVAAPRSVELKQVPTIGKTPEQISDEESRVIEAKLAEVLSYCKPILSGYERDAAKKAKHAFWLSMSGLIAGSVIGPALIAKSAAANAPWTSALSGWAGATNFAGQNLRTSGLSGTTVAQTRNDIIADLKSNIATATDGGNIFSVRRNALLKASASCTVYEIAVPTVADAD